MTIILPSSSLIITDILFLVEVNSIIFSNLYLVSKSLSLEMSTIKLLSSSLPLKTYPKYFAALTRASSSGDYEL